MIIEGREGILKPHDSSYLLRMNGDLKDFSHSQWRAISHLCTEIAQLGTSLRYEWPASPASPYLTERLAFLSAIEMEREECEFIDPATLYGRLFNAKPEGCRYRADFGAGMRIEKKFCEIMDAYTDFDGFRLQPPVPPGLRHMRKRSEPAPVRAMARAREYRKKCYSEERSAFEAQRVLAEEGMFPASPLPFTFHVPRLRADGDWMIGALRRFKAALQESLDILVAADAYMTRCEAVLGDTLRKDAVAWRAAPVIAGKPTLRQDELSTILGVSKKAAIAALSCLEQTGLAVEIRGLEKWQVWTAADDALGLPKAA